MPKKKAGKGGDFVVGYGKPPREHQFKKGTSGNPLGRPKNALNRKTILKELVEQRIDVKIAGQIMRLTRVELAYLRFVNHTIEKGDAKSIQVFDDLMTRYGIGNDPVSEQPKPPQTIFMIPHNGRGPISGPAVLEDPDAPYDEWSRRKPTDAAEILKKLKER